MKATLIFIITILLFISCTTDSERAINVTDEENSLIIRPMTTENKFGLEETARFMEELEVQLKAEGYEQWEIEHRIRQIADQIREERLRIRNQERFSEN